MILWSFLFGLLTTSRYYLVTQNVWVNPHCALVFLLCPNDTVLLSFCPSLCLSFCSLTIAPQKWESHFRKFSSIFRFNIRLYFLCFLFLKVFEFFCFIFSNALIFFTSSFHLSLLTEQSFTTTFRKILKEHSFFASPVHGVNSLLFLLSCNCSVLHTYFTSECVHYYKLVEVHKACNSE